MSNNNTSNTNKKQFVVGKTVNVWKTTGVRNLKGGPCTSERTGGDYEDIEPTEELMVLKKFGSTRALVRRENGDEVTMHINHINPSSTYYAARGETSSQKPSIDSAKKELEIAMKAYEKALAEQEAAEKAAAMAEQAEVA